MIEREVPVFPPAEYLQPCSAEPVTQIDAVLEALAGLVECERADKAALRRWIEERRPSPES